jgi:hypothetical protein
MPMSAGGRIPEVRELNIGHFLVGEAIFVGLDAAIREMRRIMDAARRGSRRVILGIGNDLVDIRRIESSLERFGDRFVQRIFTEIEQKRSEGRATRARRATPSASPPRRPAPRRSAPACDAACSGATWASSTCAAAGRPWRSPAARSPA